MAMTVSNNFPYKPITSILESYILSPIYTSRIGLLSYLEVFKVNENNYFMGIQENQTKYIMLREGNRLVEFVQSACYASI